MNPVASFMYRWREVFSFVFEAAVDERQGRDRCHNVVNKTETPDAENLLENDPLCSAACSWGGPANTLDYLDDSSPTLTLISPKSMAETFSLCGQHHHP